MNQNILGIQKPRTDDKPLWDILDGMTAASTLFVALDLKLFPLLTQKQRCTFCRSITLAVQYTRVVVSSTDLVVAANEYLHLAGLETNLPSVIPVKKRMGHWALGMGHWALGISY